MMTVGDLRELLSKYEADRLVYVGGYTFWEPEGVRSVEPDGAVLIVTGSSVGRELFAIGEEAKR